MYILIKKIHIFFKWDCDPIQPYLGLNIHQWMPWNEFEVFTYLVAHF